MKLTVSIVQGFKVSRFRAFKASDVSGATEGDVVRPTANLSRPTVGDQRSTNAIKRLFSIWLFLTLAAFGQAEPAQRVITGKVKSGSVPLPGVAIVLSDEAGHKVITSTDANGSFRAQLSADGHWKISAELSGFATASQEVTVDAAHPALAVELRLTLLSRTPASTPHAPATAGGARAAGQPRGMPNSANLRQRLNAMPDELSSAASAAATPDTPLPGMPSLATSADAANESLAITGPTASSTDFTRNLDDLRDRVLEMRANGQLPAEGLGQVLGGMGGLGGLMGGPGGGGRVGGIGRFNVNKVHGSFVYTGGNSDFNASPYSLSGIPSSQPGYASNKLGGTIGGPLNIPHVYEGGTKTFFFVNFNVTRSNTLYDAFSHVPTQEERDGDFAGTRQENGQPVVVLDPSNNFQPFPNDTLSHINPVSAALLNLIPLPNQPASQQNFRFTNAEGSNTENLGIRLIHNFGSPQNGRRGMGFRSRNNINFALNFTGSASDLPKPFPALGGKTDSHGERAQLGYSASRGRWTNQMTFTFNQQQTGTQNHFAGVENVAGLAGINGISTNPANWGAPGLSFADYTGISDVVPQNRRDQVFQGADTLILRRGKHTYRLGGDARRLLTGLRQNSDPNGSFTFTGFATGYDFADFLLGMPQQTALQYGPYAYSFRANGYDLFGQDSWRLRSNVSMELGLRYEYVSPYSEAHDRIANLDPTTNFASVTPVLPGQVGPYFSLPGLVKPDRHNYAPRIGIAWKPVKKTVVRAGYGINYNLGQYKSIVRQLAFQPPFSFTQTTNACTAINPNSSCVPSAQLMLQNGFPAPAPGTITNNYGIDPNYRLGYVQMWNLNVQYELSPTLLLNVGYTGSKGSGLDMVRAPNRGPEGLLIPNAQAFLWETSQGFSILHAGSLRLRKRMARGLSVGGTYTFAKSIDNASSIGGGATVVAQNDLDLAAERGLSSFDVRQRLTGDYVYEFPLGTGKRWLDSGGIIAHILGDWNWSGDVTIQSGMPWSAQVVGNVADVNRGTNGTLRADYNGQPIALPNPGIAEWFNTAAFSVPPLGQFGNSGRNIIIGPGQIDFDMSLNKNIPMRDMMGFEIRLSANNIFNTPHYTTIDTNVSSHTFGQVTAVGAMRQLTVQGRFRF
jgi:hypothetical protein